MNDNGELTDLARKIGQQVSTSLGLLSPNCGIAMQGARVMVDDETGEVIILYEFNASGMTRPISAVLDDKTAKHLTSVIGYPAVCGMGKGSCVPTIAVRVRRPRPLPTLPTSADLDVSAIPGGGLRVPIGICADSGAGLAQITAPLSAFGAVTIIAGQSGYGKSTFVHNALLTLCERNSPDRVNIMIFDAKGEFSLWSGAPHVAGIASDGDAMASMAESVVNIVRDRQASLAGTGYVNVKEYNNAVSPSNRIPALLVYVDEAVTTSVLSPDAMNTLAAIATICRSVGVSLWVSTQYATAAAGLPRLISVNASARVNAYQGDETAQRASRTAQVRVPPIPGRLSVTLGGSTKAVQGFRFCPRLAQRITRGESPVIGELERAMLRAAVAENGGLFGISWLCSRFPDVPRRRVVEVSTDLDRLGYLGRSAGVTTPRHVMPQYAGLFAG